MGFDEEWSRLRAQAAEQQQGTSMRLNGADEGPPPGLGGQADLASTPAEKKAAADTIDNELMKMTTDATDWADEATSAAAKEFADWETGASLKKVSKTWDKQVKVLMGRLATESSALRGTAVYFNRNELDINGQFTPLLTPQTGPYASGLNGV
ncbi:hypothetical protein [Streptomyces sp. NPDC058330]|uniref:hypothetical protein n=1 Tax=Streptomyces sp. NPDC058330 TaxID=3346449 RepID=UPI0036E14A66